MQASQFVSAKTLTRYRAWSLLPLSFTGLMSLFLLLSLSISLLSTSRLVLAEETEGGIVTYNKTASETDEDSWYIGIGAGVSRLQPDINEARNENPEVQLADDSDTAFQVFAGFELNRYWAVELIYATLGGVDVENTQEDSRVEYDRFVGASGVYHWYIPEYSDWSVYGKAGLGTLSFNGIGQVAVDEEENAQFFVGGGLEKRFTSQWALRLDGLSVDFDVKYLTMNVLKRIGISATAKAIAETFLITEHKTHYDTKIFYYEESVWELTDKQKERLEEIASEFAVGGANRIEISAYSDALGKEQYNYWISSVRAKEVFRYLRYLGIPELELEVNPVNSTDDQWIQSGSKKTKESFSRRVELRILKKDDYDF